MDCACDGQDVREGGGVWLSLVERYVRDVEVAGSNPVTPTGRELNESEPQAKLEFSRSRVDALSEAGAELRRRPGRELNIQFNNGVWLSLVEHYVRDVGAAGSNPVTPT